MSILEVGEQLVAPVETSAMREREARVAHSLRTINGLTQLMVDEELALVPVSNVDEIGSAPDVYVLNRPDIESRQFIDVAFAFQPTLLSGAADSGHAVLAGELSFENADGSLSTLPVAAKCHSKRESFEERLERAKREVFFMQALERQGEITTSPIAMVVAPEDGSFNREVLVFTAYNDGLLTLDNQPWGRGLTAGNKARALDAVKTLGRYHTMGIWHGDAQIKNFAEDQRRKDVGMIDYETSRLIDPYDPEQVGIAVYEDFGKLLKSLSDKRFLQDEDASRQTMDELGEEYVSRWGGFPTAVQDAAYGAIVAAIVSAGADLRSPLAPQELITL